MPSRVTALALGLALGVLAPGAGAAHAAGAPIPSTSPSTSPSTGPTASPSASPTGPEPEEPVLLDAAELRWGINNESNNRAFAPDTFNFFSAGRVPDPGRGGQTIRQQDWAAAAGAVRIEKWDGDGWRRATWAGLRTDSDGRPLGSPTAGTFSNHSFVLGGGEGTLDPETGEVRIAWEGEVTVLYYSGMSFFTLADPVLQVTDGVGQVTARVSGYASSVDDPDSWAPVPARTVVLANLPSVSTSDGRGFTAEPAYRGVRVSGVPQATGTADSGAFPQSYVDYMDRLGTAAFWYSSGAATDPFKVPLPLSVSYDAEDAVEEPVPTAPPTLPPLEQPTPTPPPAGTTEVAVPPPAAAQSGAPSTGSGPVTPRSAQTRARGGRAAGGVPDGDTAAALAGSAPPVTLTATTAVSAGDGPADPVHPGWWVGAGLLLLAASLAAGPAARRPRPAPPTPQT